MSKLVEFLDAAREAGLRGADALEGFRRRMQVREKGRFDLVTDADIASQRAVFGYLQQRFPDHAFLGEEEGAHRRRPEKDSPPTWIVDPIDGTTNFVHDFPFFCVSIGLQIAGEMVVGVVYEPTRKEMFHAAAGHGAFLNDNPLRVSATDSLNGALLATGFPADVSKQENILAWWHHFSLKTQSLRRTGSTALNLVYVAAGRFDGYWAFDNNVWDVAGGIVVLREAGGLVTNVDGTPYDPYTPDALATNGALHQTMLAEFRNGLRDQPTKGSRSSAKAKE